MNKLIAFIKKDLLVTVSYRFHLLLSLAGILLSVAMFYFIGRTFKFRVSKVALWEFLKKYGLDRASLEEARQAAAQTAEEKPVIASLEAPSQEGRVPAVSDEFI